MIGASLIKLARLSRKGLEDNTSQEDQLETDERMKHTSRTVHPKSVNIIPPNIQILPTHFLTRVLHFLHAMSASKNGGSRIPSSLGRCSPLSY